MDKQKKYIESESAIRIVVMKSIEHFADPDVATDIIHGIENIPAADVRPVVLCKNCKNRFNYGHLCVSRGDDWFCGYGEPKHNYGVNM